SHPAARQIPQSGARDPSRAVLAVDRRLGCWRAMDGGRAQETRLATRAHARTARYQRVAAALQARQIEWRRRAVLLGFWAALSTVGVIVTALLRGAFDPLEMVFFA